ncbi:MAG: hypothetical protein KAW92_00970 [Candidatus Cloacimonetes bacterium]|nr:hypothetical protein [Candidatus Cloacimonadota bacterium]
MANLIFKLPEVINLVKLNAELPSQIKTIEVVENRIRLTINAGKLIPNINVFISFDSFQKGMVKLKIEAGKVLKLFSKYLFQIIEKKSISNVIFFHNGEMLHVELNRILEQKVKGIQIKSIIENNGIFKLVF